MFKSTRRTWLIAVREYLAFVRTVGFWLSLFTLPLIICLSVILPVLMAGNDAPRTVAVLDLSQTGVGAVVESTFAKRSDVAPSVDSVARQAVDGRERARAMSGTSRYRLAPVPQELNGLSLEATEARLKTMMAEEKPPVDYVIVALDGQDGPEFHVWSKASNKGRASRALGTAFNTAAFDVEAKRLGLTPEVTAALKAARPVVVDLTPITDREGGKSAQLVEAAKTNGPRALGIFISYISWIAIFSSSMILLGSVIEEKASKVMEVLLASASTGEILVGKVLGVAMVMLTVGLFWMAAIGAVLGFGISFLPPDMMQVANVVLSGLLSPTQIVLMLTYFAGGYLMFGVGFAAIGAFCETQKDAQAIIGPFMIVLMIPMFALQAAIFQPDLAAVKALSYVPLFTPFLMPVRLSQPLEWWEIGVTLFGMWLLGVLLIRLGSRAFRQGALGGGKFSWKLMGQLMMGRTSD